MPTLSITNFSCLEDASLILAPVTVIIGPQGSGKSVTTKVLYFCVDITQTFIQFAERGESLERYRNYLSRQFSSWFPPSAWGQRRFNITYSAEPFSMRILRRQSKGKLTDEVSITFNDWFADTYKSALDLFSQHETIEDASDSISEVRADIDRSFRTREWILHRMRSKMGGNFISSQTFIPAGRAFFTSIGRLVAGIEQPGSLDPVTVKFAKLFATLRDRGPIRLRPSFLSHLPREFVERRKDFMTRLFGGEIKFENETEYVEAEDGRRIPFSALSSGQQELLPMWSLIDYFAERNAVRAANKIPIRRTSRELIYIEEPEAHLFPSAQSLLMEFLIGSLTRTRGYLILTTHSPYIMGKLNVFLKAGKVQRKYRKSDSAEDRRVRALLEKIVPRDCWLSRSQLSAIAIEGGRLRNLIDSDELIDAHYLDEISDEIARDFSSLLELEYESE